MKIDPIEAEARMARRSTFDDVADLYDEMRPGYPQAVFDDILGITGAGPASRLLEIGCGSGHATLDFARRGLAIDCIELGANMAALARRNLAAFDRVTVTVADFDHWSTDTRYDLIYSASAYHWLNPATRIERIACLLAHAGWLAVWRNHHVRGSGASEAFFHAAQAVYAREAPTLAVKFTGLLDPGQIASTEKDQWFASGLFCDAQTRVYQWRKEHTANEYIRMLDTHSDHRLLPQENRERLFAGLAALIDDFGGLVTREHATILHVAKKTA
jgi:SAM-dependent methyltransferase